MISTELMTGTDYDGQWRYWKWLLL